MKLYLLLSVMLLTSCCTKPQFEPDNCLAEDGSFVPCDFWGKDVNKLLENKK